MKNYSLYLTIIFLFHHCTGTATQKAVVCVPVADLIGQPLSTIYAEKNSSEAYQSLAVCSGKLNTTKSCPRLHQLLYNDIVEIIKTEKNEAYIKISQAFFITPSSSTPQNCYWTLKSNLKTFDELHNNNISTNHIPIALNFNDTTNNNKNIITLTQPHYDPHTQVMFSAGTRFVQIPSHTKKKVKVYVIDYNTLQMHHITLPSEKCVFSSTQTKEVCIQSFITLLQKWAHQQQGFIPYVWGGTSFTYTNNTPFQEITHNNPSPYSFYQYNNDAHLFKHGFDCSGLILRAAQIVGIPYFYKNTTTIKKYLSPLTPDTPLSNGDLILIKHVIVVSDIEKNLLIEARGYEHGYGKLHETTLSTVFDGINTYAELCDAFFNKKTIHRKDIHGTVKDSFPDFQILKIASVWK